MFTTSLLFLAFKNHELHTVHKNWLCFWITIPGCQVYLALWQWPIKSEVYKALTHLGLQNHDQNSHRNHWSLVNHHYIPNISRFLLNCPGPICNSSTSDGCNWSTSCCCQRLRIPQTRTGGETATMSHRYSTPCTFVGSKCMIGGFHSHGGTPKWMVYFMGNPIKLDDIGVPPFQETSICVVFSNLLVHTN